MDAVIRVYTFKEGLLSKLAHDLALKLGSFEIEARGDTVQAVLECSSFEVEGALRDGRLVPNALGENDRAKIVQNLAEDVLRTKRFPQARLSGTVARRGSAVLVTGSLALCGVSQPVQLTLQGAAGRLLGEIEFAPTRFGIKPFRALGGTLKVQDRVRVSIDVEAPGDLSQAGVLRWSARS